MVVEVQIDLALEAIAAFCRKWKIREFAVFGSVLREDFRPDSDIDVLVTFESERHGWGFRDWVHMQDELREILGRDVDLLSRSGIQRSNNPWRKKEILGSARTIYVAA